MEMGVNSSDQIVRAVKELGIGQNVHHILNIELSQGEYTQCYLWQAHGVSGNIAGTIVIALGPPQEKDLLLEVLTIMNSCQEEVCTIWCDRQIGTALKSDSGILPQIWKFCVKCEYLPQSCLSAIGDTLTPVGTPSKSPPAKKAKGSSANHVPCKKSLFADPMENISSGPSEAVSIMPFDDVDDTDDAAQDNVNDSAKELTAIAEVHNIPEPFFKQHFLYFLNSSLWDSGLSNEGELIALSCSDRSNSGTATVEFRSVSEATTACFVLEECLYGKGRIQFTQQKRSVDRTVMSAFVRMYNVPNVLFEDHFMCSLNSELSDAQLSVGEVQAVSCRVVQPGVVIVEFRNTSEALSVCQEEEIKYDGKILLLEHLKVADLAPHVLKSPSPPLKEPTATSSLQTDEEIKAFLDECTILKIRQKVAKFKATNQNIQAVLIALQTKHSINASVDDYRNLYKKLNRNHRRNPRGKWRKHLEFLQSVPGCICPLDEAAVSGDQAQQKDYSSDWKDKNSVLSLIDVMIDMKDEYNKAHKHVGFWFKVSQALRERDLFFTPISCKSKWEELVSQYKNHNAQRNKSGSGAVSWPWFSHLEPLLADNVSVEPLKTLSSGVFCRSSENKGLVSTAELQEERRGRARTSPSSTGTVNSCRKEKQEQLKSLIDSRLATLEKLSEIAKLLKDRKP